jgi:hypothetical protein
MWTGRCCEFSLCFLNSCLVAGGKVLSCDGLVLIRCRLYLSGIDMPGLIRNILSFDDPSEPQMLFFQQPQDTKCLQQTIRT